MVSVFWAEFQDDVLSFMASWNHRLKRLKAKVES